MIRGGLFQNPIYLRVLTGIGIGIGIGIDSGENLTNFPLAIHVCIKKSAKRKSPVENPRKFKEKIHIENQRWAIQSGYKESCLAAQTRFLLY